MSVSLMKRVCIGIHVHAEPERLHATLVSLRSHTTFPYDLLLLPDGPDTATQVALAALREVPQLPTTDPRGAPACFNRLATANAADVVILLESGAVVGPGWLDHLLVAFAADPQNGLAGPSTNHAWNEQCVFPHSKGTLAEVTRTARDALNRFGGEVRTLE